MTEQFGLNGYFKEGGRVEGIRLTEPLGYLQLLHLNLNAKIMLTDSGGLQEETTVLGVPCLTIRQNTERPVTCEMWTKVVVGNKRDDILMTARRFMSGNIPHGRIPDRWDGRAAERIVQILLDPASRVEADK
jgi:UDP-N-acetylglucosamine 2-epimerase (non-hydrolysing)